ncbi:MAG TPA: hypothetical protein VL122_03590 [Nitrospirota bacterium]|nr:hypothetical protein [Nitrospirota bacterium]
MVFASRLSLVVTVGVTALVAWRVYSRVRRMVGRQQLSGVRQWVTICLFPVLLALLLGSFGHPGAALATVAGVGLGAVLGMYGLRLTTFEQTLSGLLYTPNARLGIALSLLFLGRIAYRAAQLYFSAVPVSALPSALARSPLTLLLFGTLAGYYVTYAVGLLRWRRRIRLSKASVEQPGGRAERDENQRIER